MMLEEMLRKAEGERLVVYDDATGKPLTKGMTLQGHPTIGVGRALDTKGITSKEADYLLMNDIYQVEAEAEKAFPWYVGLKDERKVVILSMLFQLGLAGVQGFHEFLLAMEHQNWARAAAEMKDSLWAKQTAGRVDKLQAQIETGVLQ